MHQQPPITCTDSSTTGDYSTSTSDACGGRGPSKQPILTGLTWGDLEVGRLLGSGSFAQVFQISPLSSSLLEIQIIDESPTCANTTQYASEVGLPENDGNRFALKTLNKDLLKEDSDPRAAQTAIACLNSEAELLSNMSMHENIIALIGVSSDLSDESAGGFLVIQRLAETLDARLKRWKRRNYIKNGYKRSSLLPFLGNRKDPEQRTRIKHIGYGVANAMKFLHQNRVLYRDLKPESKCVASDVILSVYSFRFLSPLVTPFSRHLRHWF